MALPMASAFAVSPTMTGTIGCVPWGIRKPDSVIALRKYVAFSRSFCTGEGSSRSIRKASSEPAATAGGKELEKRDGRLLCRSVSIKAFGPAVKPPAAEPIALPSVPVVTSIRSITPCSSAVPRPVGPSTPVACESSTANRTSLPRQIRASSRRFASSPSIEKTPSVIMRRKREVVSSASIFASEKRMTGEDIRKVARNAERIVGAIK